MTVSFAMHYLPNWVHVTFWSIYLFVLFCFVFHLPWQPKCQNGRSLEHCHQTKKVIFRKSQQCQKFYQAISDLFTLHAFYSHLQQLKEEEVLLVFVEERRNESQVGVHCVSQVGVHFVSLELCIKNILSVHVNNQ